MLVKRLSHGLFVTLFERIHDSSVVLPGCKGLIVAEVHVGCGSVERFPEDVDEAQQDTVTDDLEEGSMKGTVLTIDAFVGFRAFPHGVEDIA